MKADSYVKSSERSTGAAVELSAIADTTIAMIRSRRYPLSLFQPIATENIGDWISDDFSPELSRKITLISGDRVKVSSFRVLQILFNKN